ncbi:MAG: tRNA (guanine-N(1)-)-methyltransferase [Candidatus Wolfebacteria bacterium GW2011_GWA2_42_10]|uniref:tRNA (guanine-N(1)-)-methyltransferase n=2 Tax=Candidatus Wolfeibacteriota TaxID=1752735 RepID=A0A0G0XKL9_9BACT|nr:MAG: tRNA (guanine-N(1)-)-methyltransferase [Candidatus Wolfebacteria bacterium GW2011_GWB1_41_12]KKS25449.1 MAG: tRNA (guanine-N(1)-)-methyltransferase [Candidatus Wolfebacteria bacterium GW2011_GWA2_42_10]KKT56625.1 MAG: tRNA (guanine-N(1)-)-methyltransferase [Candidatus Wolfebacteria bacterium GW2011_GWA1_44_24]
MRFDIITIFPKIFSAKGGSYLNESILKRAQKNKLVDIKIHNLRDFTKDKHRKVDDRPFGGGPGMVITVEPIIKAVSNINRQASKKKIKVILFTPGGKQFNNKTAANLAKNYDNLILICGRYEGIDARVEKVIENLKLKIENLSVGPYVLTGGELPAMVLIDAVSRQIPGVLGKQESLEEKRYGAGLSVYTRPEVLKYKGKKYKVPKILLSGNHKKIDEWRREN